MFRAYSKPKQKSVNVEDEFNLNEEFLCLNPKCSAKFRIKSPTGKKSKHFARLKSTPHIQGCPYEKGNNKYLNNDKIIKNSLESIFLNEKNSHERMPQYKNQNPSKNTSETDFIYIRTTKQLLKYCITNDLETEYRDGLTVNDIIFDHRNLSYSGNFMGISGMRLILAETINYDSPNSLNLKLYGRTKHKKELTLHIRVILAPHILQKITSYMIDTYGNFKEHSLAILGDWKIDKKYHIFCRLADESHIIIL